MSTWFVLSISKYTVLFQNCQKHELKRCTQQRICHFISYSIAFAKRSISSLDFHGNKTLTVLFEQAVRKPGSRVEINLIFLHSLTKPFLTGYPPFLILYYIFRHANLSKTLYPTICDNIVIYIPA